MKPQAVIVGAGGHAISVAETVLAAGYDLVAFTSDQAASGDLLLGRPVLDSVPSGSELVVVLAIGDNTRRQRLWRALGAAARPDRFPAVIHPSASVAGAAQVGAGTVVMQGAIIGNGAVVGEGCILNSGSVLEHECRLEDFASLAPRAATGGRVHISERAALSIGATVKHGTRIGSDSVIGAASYVHRDIPAGVIAYGVPARVVRQRRADEPYL